TVFPEAKRVRFETRKMCVSTAMVGWPKAVFNTTLAVLRPTPGSASKSLRLSGTWLLCLSIKILQVLITFSALVLNKQMLLVYSFRLSTTRVEMAAGVLATGNSLSVALFTPTSVACADKITAINNSKSLLTLSSVVGLARWAFKRLKISIRFCLFMVVFGLINWRVNRWLPWLVREPVGPLYFLWQGALRFVAAGAIAVRHRLQWQFDIGFVRAPRLVR